MMVGDGYMHKTTSHNPYFNRWFSAIMLNPIVYGWVTCHNPYFNRWFSAIFINGINTVEVKVTILILIDGFLQSKNLISIIIIIRSHNPYFNRWFSAMLVVCVTQKATYVTILILIDGFLQ